MSRPRLSPGLYHDLDTVPVGTPLRQPIVWSELLFRLRVLREPVEVQDAAVRQWLLTNVPEPWLADDIRAHRPQLMDGAPV